MKKFWAIVVTGVVAFILLCYLLLGCSVLKKNSSKRDAEGNINKSSSSSVDTTSKGNVSKNNSSSRELFDWEKFTQHFSKDTTVNNTYVYPSTVVYERGNSLKESESNQFDSNWIKNALIQQQAKYDSLYKERTVEQSLTKTTTDWKLYAIIALAIFFFIDKLPFTIKRKK